MDCDRCGERIIEIDRHGERLIGCFECNCWSSSRNAFTVVLSVEDFDARASIFGESTRACQSAREVARSARQLNDARFGHGAQHRHTA